MAAKDKQIRSDGDLDLVGTTVKINGTEAPSTDPTTLSDAAATSLGLKQYYHGTSYNGGNAPTVSSDAAATVSIIRGVFVPYQTQDGTWRMTCNINLSHGSDTTHTITVNGITLKNVSNYYQPLACVNNDGQAVGNPNTGTWSVTYSANKTGSHFSGDVELDSKPTWAY